MRHLTTLLLALLLLVAPAAAQSGGDDAFQPLLTDFGRLYNALKNSRGLSESDRPAVRALLDRVDEFTAQWPDHAGGAAMGLQLSKWLDDDEEVSTFYDRLTALRPGDAELAISRLRHREAKADLSDDELIAEYVALQKRFPTSLTVGGGLATLLKAQARYQEAIYALRALDLNTGDAAQQMYDLADCLFAEHEFEEAAELANQLAEANVADFRLRSNVDRLKTTTAEYLELWPKEQEIRAREKELDDLPRVEVKTARGVVVVELLENEAPNTVANFISLAESDFYPGTKFHRFEPDFMIQGGDPLSKEGATGVPGTGDPGYYIPDEHGLENHRVHFRDSVAMAKRTAENSGGCQFYFNHRPTPWLNGKHTVFGRVVEGHDIARKLRKDDEILSVTVIRKRDHAYEPKTLPK
ncbi:MAG: peptidylprolyl isomerase [Planctomycetota bacterium]|jgi:cyclophilin family peptidyl-prolyl cis-trans isomerase